MLERPLPIDLMDGNWQTERGYLFVVLALVLTSFGFDILSRQRKKGLSLWASPWHHGRAHVGWMFILLSTLSWFTVVNTLQPFGWRFPPESLMSFLHFVFVVVFVLSVWARDRHEGLGS